MADLRYTVDVDTRGAQTALNGLKSTIATVGSAFAVGFGVKEIVQIAARFEDLRTTLNFLYRDIEGGGEQAFNAIKQFATESVFSVEDLTASVIKLKAAGINPTLERLRLFADVSSIATDSVGALQAITDLFARTTAGGLGLEDLNRLADRGIPVFDILQEKLGITRLEVSKLGQTTEGAQLILKALEEGLSETFSGASAERANNLSQAFSNLEDAIANTADIIGRAGLNESLGNLIRSFTTVLEQNKLLIKSISEGLIVALKVFAEQLKYVIGLIALVFTVKTITRLIAAVKAFNAMRNAIGAAATAAAVLQGVTGVGLIKLAAGMAAVAGVVAGIDEMIGDASDNIQQLEEDAKNLSNETLSFPDAPDTSNIPTDSTLTPLRKELQEIQSAQNAATIAAINYFDEYREGVEDLKRATEQEGKLLKMTEAQANVQRELNKFTQRYYDTVRPLQRQVEELKAKDTEQSRQQAEEIERQIGLITNLYNNEIAGLRTVLELREQINREEERDALFARTRLELERDLRDLVRDSKNELENLNLTPFEKQLKDIDKQIDDTLMKSIDKLKGEWQDEVITTDEYIAELAKLREEGEKTSEILKEQARQAREIQRSFAYGWKTAFESYVDEATNAATAAERIFEKTTKGMEDMIVNFAKTGKFEFKSFMADILETLLRSQVQQLIAQTFSMPMGGGRSAGGGLGDFFAGFFANGGTIPAGQFGVVGERGAELVAGPATVTPMSGSTNVTYNIQAVDAASFKSMVARDPAFIHAVASQGARKVPMGR